MSKPVSLSDLLGGLGAEAAQAVQAALIRAVSLGESIASITKTIMDALNTSLFRALTVARNLIVGGFREAFMGTGRASAEAIGWYWITDLTGSPCIACVLMSGTKHSMDEDMESHVNCACTMEYFTAQDAQDSGDMQSGEDWFNEQDDSTQEDILGPGKYQTWSDGTVSLADFLGTDSEGRIYVKSLKQLGVR